MANNLSYQFFINCIMVYEWNLSGILEASILFIDGIEHDGTCFFFPDVWYIDGIYMVCHHHGPA